MSRERVDEDFRAWDMRQMEYESRCPVCVVCGEHITSTDKFYDIDGQPVCDDINCIMGYLDQFKKNIDTWITNQEG